MPTPAMAKRRRRVMTAFCTGEGLYLDYLPDAGRGVMFRHMQGDMIDDFFCHLVAQFSALAFFRFAGEVKTIGARNMEPGRRQCRVHHSGYLKSKRYLLRKLAS